MSCYTQEEEGRVGAVLCFKRDQLLYDIKNYAYIEGHILADENTHTRHMVQDVGEDGNVDRITRVLNLTVAKCKELLYPYTKRSIHRSVLDDKLREPGVYGIILNVPKDFSQTTLYLLEKLIHEYLVCKAIADWMSIVNPTKTEIWEAKANVAENEIRANANTRMSRKRRRLAPF